MTCRSRSRVCGEMFTERAARRSLRRYRRKGLDETERSLVAAAAAAGGVGGRVLEIGGGIGALQAELLVAGAVRGEVVEVVGAYEPYARELAEEKRIGDRTAFRVVDLLADPDAVERADVVILNRVVCCSPDGVGLTAAGARLARKALVLSYPRDAWWVRAFVRLQNAGLWLLRRSFRVFVHDPVELVAAGVRAGLVPERRSSGVVWEIAVLRRA